MSGSLSSGSSSPSPLSSSVSSSSPSSSPWASEHDHLKPLHPWYRLASRQPFVLAERSFLAQGQDEHRELVGGTEQTDLHVWFEARRSWERHRYGQVCVGREFQVDAERIPPPDAPHSDVGVYGDLLWLPSRVSDQGAVDAWVQDVASEVNVPAAEMGRLKSALFRILHAWDYDLAAVKRNWDCIVRLQPLPLFGDAHWSESETLILQQVLRRYRRSRRDLDAASAAWLAVARARLSTKTEAEILERWWWLQGEFTACKPRLLVQRSVEGHPLPDPTRIRVKNLLFKRRRLQAAIAAHNRALPERYSPIAREASPSSSSDSSAAGECVCGASAAYVCPLCGLGGFCSRQCMDAGPHGQSCVLLQPHKRRRALDQEEQ